MLVKVGEGALVLEELTARKYLTLKQRVYDRQKKWIFITQPYGANRTPEQQGYLRKGYEYYTRTGKGPVFYYAAKVGDSNHEGGHAFDINNWESVGEEVIKQEAAKLGLVRDPKERWHWNDTGIQVAGLLHVDAIDNEGADMGDYSKSDQANKRALVWDIWGRGVLGDDLKSGVVGDGGKPTSPIDQIMYSASRISQLGDYMDNHIFTFPNHEGLPMRLEDVLNAIDHNTGDLVRNPRRLHPDDIQAIATAVAKTIK